MISVFISYSSKDNSFVTNLVNDLKRMGFEVWLDKWKIRVGDDIFEKIQYGIRNSDFVIVVLSRNAISSGWVDKEWKMVYWNEITSRRVKLLPVLLEDCEIPEFLKFKKYADFRKGYDEALEELLRALKSVESLPMRKEDERIRARNGISKLELFRKVYNYTYSLSGMNLSRESAKQFALEWMEKHRYKDFDLLEEVYNYAYSVSGMNLSHEGAKQFALQWFSKRYYKDFDRFKEIYDYAYSLSGMNLSHEGAKQFALEWMEKRK